MHQKRNTDMTYYIKKCNSQELGSIGANGRPRRGRYLFVSKSPEVLSLFPPLSETTKNDFTAIPIIPLYLKKAKKVYCQFVYHNDKFHGSTAPKPRNEYRLYSCKKLEGEQWRFKAGNYIIIRKVDESEINPGLYLDYVTPSRKTLYGFCAKQVKNSSLIGAHALWDKRIKAFEDKVDVIKRRLPFVEIDEKVLDATSSVPSRSVASLFTNQEMFRDFLMVGYEAKCAITRQVISYRNLYNLEAAHLRPRSHKGLFVPSNGVLMSRDLHWAFDKGFFSFTNDLKVLVHPKIKSGFLKKLNGVKLFLPKDPFFRPSLQCVKWHREKIYGMFLHSGLIKKVDA